MNEENLTLEQRADLVAYYFERAHESVDEAKSVKVYKCTNEQSRASAINT